MNVLILDDAPEQLAFICHMFVEQRISYLAVETPSLAWDTFVENTEISTVISDRVLPDDYGRSNGNAGVQFLRRAKDHRPNVRTVLVSAYFEADPSELKISNVDAIFLKPLLFEDPDPLLRLIKAAK